MRSNPTSALSKRSSAPLLGRNRSVICGLAVCRNLSIGITDAIKSKVTIPDTDVVSELVAKGELELGVVVMTQILTTPGVELAGPLPAEIQFYTTFVGGVSGNSKVPDAARDLIRYSTGPTAAPAIKSLGMEPE